MTTAYWSWDAETEDVKEALSKALEEFGIKVSLMNNEDGFGVRFSKK